MSQLVPAKFEIEKAKSKYPKTLIQDHVRLCIRTELVARGLPFTPSFYQAFIESVRLGSPIFQICTQAKNHPTFILSMGSKMSQVYGFIIFVEEQWYIII